MQACIDITGGSSHSIFDPQSGILNEWVFEIAFVNPAAYLPFPKTPPGSQNIVFGQRMFLEKAMGYFQAHYT